MGIYGPEKLRIWTLFAQCITHRLPFPAVGLKTVNPFKSLKLSLHKSKAYYELKLFKAIIKLSEIVTSFHVPSQKLILCYARGMVPKIIFVKSFPGFQLVSSFFYFG